MDYKAWVNLFGKAADDPAIAKAVAQAGVTKALTIGSDELSVAADLPGSGLTIEFTDESIVRPETGLIGRPVFTSVLMTLQSADDSDLYRGPLPFGIIKATSKDAMRARFGEPIESEERRRWDAWLIDGLRVMAAYSRDLQSIVRLAIELPRKD
jgi:hypothetical protein